MKRIEISLVFLTVAVAVESSTLCARKSKSCTYQLWTNDSVPDQACMMTHYRLNSRECGALNFDYTIDTQNSLGDVRLHAYVTEHFRQVLFRISYRNIKWRRMLLRFTRMGLEDEKNMCRRFSIWENVTVPNISTLVYDCPFSESEYEGQDYSLEYEYTSPQIAYTRFIFRVPYFENFGNSADVKTLQVFTYLDVSDSDYLHLHIQAAPATYNITGYLVEVIRERSNISTRLTVQILNLNEIVDGELVFPYPTWNEFGYFYFTVAPLSDVCDENTCLKTATPKIFMGRKKSSLVIGIVGASVIVFALFYAMFFWNRQKGNNKENNAPVVLLVYKASLNSHCNVVRNLARVLNDVLQIEVLLDVFEVPLTGHQDPIIWCNQAFTSATHIVYVASPEVPPNKVNANSIYRIEGVAMKFINKELVRNYSSKQILVVTFPYSVNAIPPELSEVRKFDLTKDMDSFVNSLIMLPYQSWTFLHLYRPNNRYRCEPQYNELVLSIMTAQRDLEIISATSPNSNPTPKITITENSEDAAAIEEPNQDGEALLNDSYANTNNGPAIISNNDFSFNVHEVAQ